MGTRTVATTSSWLTSLVPLALAALCSSSQAGEAACPREQAGTRLASVSVFDGPPGEHADLVPDRYRETKDGGRSEWDVAYAFQAGRKLYVECRYGGEVPPVVIEPAPTTTTLCTFVARRQGRTSLGYPWRLRPGLGGGSIHLSTVGACQAARRSSSEAASASSTSMSRCSAFMNPSSTARSSMACIGS